MGLKGHTGVWSTGQEEAEILGRGSSVDKESGLDMKETWHSYRFTRDKSLGRWAAVLGWQKSGYACGLGCPGKVWHEKGANPEPVQGRRRCQKRTICGRKRNRRREGELQGVTSQAEAEVPERRGNSDRKPIPGLGS